MPGVIMVILSSGWFAQVLACLQGVVGKGAARGTLSPYHPATRQSGHGLDVPKARAGYWETWWLVLLG